MRYLRSSNEFFDILDGIKGGTFVSIGYVTGANLNIPKVKRKNPLTGRMKGYFDYSVLNSTNEIGALVKITSYTFNYRNRQSIHDDYYNRVKPEMNRIRTKYGAPEVQDRVGYKSVNNYGVNGIETYSGNNETKFGNSYSPQNMYNAKIDSIIYAIDTNGNIVQELTKEEIKPYLASKKIDSGLKALRDMNAEENVIQSYIEEINGLKFSYRNFEADSILWMTATVNGEKVVYINDQLSRTVDDININKDDFIRIAKERYRKDLANIQETLNRINNKKMIRLTESDLKNIIKESVNKILNERTKSEKGLSDKEVTYRRDMAFLSNIDDDDEDSIYSDKQDDYKRRIHNRRINHHKQNQNHKNSMYESIIHKTVNKILNENIERFCDEFERLKNDCVSHGEDFGFELMNKNGEYEYGDIEYDIDNNSLSCLGVCIRPNLMYDVEKNLGFLYDSLLKNGFVE